MSRKRSVPEPSFSFGVNVLRLNQTFDHLDNEDLRKRLVSVINIDDWEHDDDDLNVSNKNIVVGPNPANRWYDKSVR